MLCESTGAGASHGGGNKRKYPCILSWGIPEHLLAAPEQYPMVDGDKEICCLSQTICHSSDAKAEGRKSILTKTIRHSSDAKAEGRESILTTDGKVVDWNSVGVDMEIYRLGVRSMELILQVEAFKLLEKACTKLLGTRGATPQHQSTVRDSKDFVSEEARVFGHTLPEVCFWPLHVDSRVLASPLVHLRKLTPPTETTVLDILRRGLELFREVFLQVLSDLESNGASIPKDSVMSNSLEFGRSDKSNEALVTQFAMYAHMKSERNKSAHPFMEGLIKPEAINAYAKILQRTGYNLQQLGGLCLLKLKVEQLAVSGKAQADSDVSDQSYLRLIKKASAKQSSASGSGSLENQLEAEILKNSFVLSE